MSAILAIFNRNRAPVEPAVVETMLVASPDRAVDGQSSWMQGHVALAHQHFWATPEEQQERQPLVAGTGRSAITADVRLDNRPALIEALELGRAEGRRLSDAALILRAYARWGTDCIDHLLGDFAFVIWDAPHQHLFVARDALGARSACYYLDRNLCLIASEIKQILAHPAVEPRLNEGKVADYLAGMWDDQEESYYESVYYCPPGHGLVITADSVRKWRYWDVDPGTRIRYRQDGEYAEHFRSLLAEAVRCRLRTVGPIGVSLSGGLDSTSVAALAATLPSQTDQRRGHLQAFSYVFDELPSCDERQYIQPVVDRYGLDITYIPGDDKWTFRNLESWPGDRGFVWHDPYAWLPVAVVTAAGQAGCRLLLTGHYGDVLFLGAPYWASDLLREFRFGHLFRILVRDGSAIRWRQDILKSALRAWAPARLGHAYRRVRSRLVRPTNPGLHPGLIERTSLRERSTRDERWRRFSAPGQWQRYRSLTNSSHPQGMASARNLYAAHGLERADPYFDRRLVEYVMAIPADQLGRPGRTRWVQRNAMEGLLPPAVLERPGKTSFYPLLERGLCQRERAAVETLMQDARIVDGRFVRAEWLPAGFDLGGIGADEGYRLWLFISLELWLRRYW